MDPILLSVSFLVGTLGIIIFLLPLISSRNKHVQLFLQKMSIDTERDSVNLPSNNPPPIVKSFIYLDEYKMYSLSSQIFEGITEYLIDQKNELTEKDESQKGHHGSGRVWATILKNETATQEKRFLHDYSYILFEKQLCEQNKVLFIDENNIENIEQIKQYSFIKVKGRAIFNDMQSIKTSLTRFNEIGEALACVGNYNKVQEIKEEVNQQSKSFKDRNQKAVIQYKASSMFDYAKLAKEQGLYQDPQFLKNLDTLLSFGFQDQFEIQIPILNYLFSSNLKRDFIKENESLLVRKYTRMTEVDFILFGVVTQCGNSNLIQLNGEEEPENLKQALMTVIYSLTNVESTFTGRLPNEIIIDPIAIYREL